MKPSFHHIGIIGVGLIGGSIHKALVLNKYPADIILFPFPIADVEFNKLVSQCDLLIIATPLSAIIDTVNKIHSNHRLVIMDVGSVKKEITQVFETLTSELIEFVSSHPFAGKKEQGSEHSDAALFEKRPWALITHSKNRKETLDSIQELILTLKAIPIIISAEAHDNYAALVSHLPALIAREYEAFVKKLAPEALNLAGPGYESFTRIAHDNPIMRKEIEEANKDIIEHYLKLWKGL